MTSFVRRDIRAQLAELNNRRTSYNPTAIQVGPREYEALPLDLVLCDTTEGAVTITLRTDHKRGDQVIAKIIVSGGYPVVIEPEDGLIDGEEARTLSGDYRAIHLISDGSDWWVL